MPDVKLMPRAEEMTVRRADGTVEKFPVEVSGNGTVVTVLAGMTFRDGDVAELSVPMTSD